jgi:hypothetical protein
MSLNVKKCLIQEDKYPEVRECISKSKKMNDALPSYEYLYALRDSIPKELYAYYYRRILQMNTANVSVELRLKMFEGVDPEDIMYQDELDAINNEFGETIVVYRGASASEEMPGISWTKYKWVAEGSDFNKGKVFMATIPKSSILLYLAHEEDEGEIIAHVTTGYKVIEENGTVKL